MTGVHQSWTSRAAFLLATTGAAVGLGNLWRFPFLAGANGGSAFVLVYLACVAAICIPVATAEIALGRMGQLSAIGSVKAIARREGAGPAWTAIGYLSVIIPFVGLAYYSVVTGWALSYMVTGMLGGLAGITPDRSQSVFGELIASPWTNLLFQGVVIGLTAYVVGRGLHAGIERATKVMMPALFLLLVVLIGYNLVAADFGRALSFLFTPDFSKVTATTVMLALGQAFFSVGVGVGFMITYGAYLPGRVSIPRSAAIVAGVDTLVAVMAGLAIFPIVFASGLSPGEGPGLVFVTMPVAFASMPFGQVLAVLFFLLLFLAAFTSTIAMLEPAVSVLEERRSEGRLTLAFATAGVIWLLGIAPALSGNLLAEVRPLSWLPAVAEKTVFETFDLMTGSVLIPLNALLIAVFAGWIVSMNAFRREVDVPPRFLVAWRLLVKILAPLAIVAITLFGFLS